MQCLKMSSVDGSNENHFFLWWMILLSIWKRSWKCEVFWLYSAFKHSIPAKLEIIATMCQCSTDWKMALREWFLFISLSKQEGGFCRAPPKSALFLILVNLYICGMNEGAEHTYRSSWVRRVCVFWRSRSEFITMLLTAASIWTTRMKFNNDKCHE